MLSSDESKALLITVRDELNARYAGPDILLRIQPLFGGGGLTGKRLSENFLFIIGKALRSSLASGTLTALVQYARLTPWGAVSTRIIMPRILTLLGIGPEHHHQQFYSYFKAYPQPFFEGDRERFVAQLISSYNGIHVEHSSREDRDYRTAYPERYKAFAEMYFELEVRYSGVREGAFVFASGGPGIDGKRLAAPLQAILKKALEDIRVSGALTAVVQYALSNNWGPGSTSIVMPRILKLLNIDPRYNRLDFYEYLQWRPNNFFECDLESYGANIVEGFEKWQERVREKRREHIERVNFYNEWDTGWP